VVVMQENRSFDHYFQELPTSGQPDVDVAGSGASNPDSAHGTQVHHHALTELCVEDPPHGATQALVQFDQGKMDGFIDIAGKGGERTMGYYPASVLPFYHQLAVTFTVGDRYFASFLGPTWPNRLFMTAGTSFGHVDNTAPPKQNERRSIFHQLEEAHQPWALYSEGPTFEEQFFERLKAERGQHFLPLEQFFRDAEAGHLPALAWVESQLGGVMGTDEHPPADVQVGQEWVWRVVDAVLRSPQWSRTALILTYDEHGGFFDHVPPPSACAPDSQASRVVDGQVVRFDRLGLRVPFVLVSPYAKPHYVSHQVYDHTSILRLIQTRFGLPALTRRDANASPLLDCFDFARPAFLTPPTFPRPSVDRAALRWCEEQHFKEEVARPGVVAAPSAAPTVHGP